VFVFVCSFFCFKAKADEVLRHRLPGKDFCNFSIQKGEFEAGDKDLSETSIREVKEELNLPGSKKYDRQWDPVVANHEGLLRDIETIRGKSADFRASKIGFKGESMGQLHVFVVPVDWTRYKDGKFFFSLLSFHFQSHFLLFLL